jgi:D-lactate dehydrogenase (cytochrome)
MEKMRAITGLYVDDKSRFYITAEPGVQLADLTDCLTRKTFDVSAWDQESRNTLELFRKSPAQFFPPDPTEATATLGGMFACDAQGLCSYRYGRTADYVQGVNVSLADGRNWQIARGQYLFDADGITLPDGRRLNVDANHDSTICSCLIPYKGMDLIDLFAGSEGMLGVVTGLTLRLLPAPAVRWAIMFFFIEFSQALEFVDSIVAAGKDACSGGIEACELFDRCSLDMVEELTADITKLRAIPDISPAYQAAVYIQLATDKAEVTEEVLVSLLDDFSACGGNESDTWAAEGADEMRKFSLFRHAVPEAANLRIDAIRRSCPDIHKTAIDFTVPAGRLKETAAMYRQGMEKSGISGIIFGHAAAGRLHVNLFPETARQFDEAWSMIDEWADRVVSMGGKLIGENGVGKIKRTLLSRYLPEKQLQSARVVKQFFDPNGLLNPGNMFLENH